MPDVTWIPVDETPPKTGYYFASGIDQYAGREVFVAWAWAKDGYLMGWYAGMWSGQYPDDAITHYAVIEFPEPPEVNDA